MNPDPLVLLRSRGYVRLLVLAALLGVPVVGRGVRLPRAVSWLEDQLFDELPTPSASRRRRRRVAAPLLVISGILSALAITRLPGRAAIRLGGLQDLGRAPAVELPGRVLRRASRP
jgi:hypothetical protein